MAPLSYNYRVEKWADQPYYIVGVHSVVIMKEVGGEIWLQVLGGRGGHSICGPLGRCTTQRGDNGHRQGVMRTQAGSDEN